MKTIEDLLKAHPFTQGLDDEILRMVAGCATNVVFDAGSYLFRQGGSADRFFLLRHGTVALEMFVPGIGEQTFLTVKSGEMLGVTWLVPPYRWAYDARAVELTRAIAFDATCLRDKCEANHHVGYQLMKRFVPALVERLHAAQMQMADIYGPGPRT
jgi:CRP/FNR family transcriptional regulator, cyclic AMP receptor protein